MFKRISCGLICFAILSCLLCSRSAADTVTLKNGTKVEGVVIKFGTEYRVRMADGTTRVIQESDVASVGRGGVVPAARGTPPTSNSSANFAAVKSRAELQTVPILAVTMWEKFIDANPGSSDLPAAQTELQKWQKLHDDHAEKINGKWIGGEEREKLLTQVAQLCGEARELLDHQTLQAVEKYEKALKLYPNSFEANFALGFFYLKQGSVGPTGRGNMADLDKAIKSLETAVKLRPNSASALSNLAVGYNFRQRYEDAVVTAFKAAKLEDNKPIVANLVNTLVHAPPAMKQNNQRVRDIIPQAAILAQKYGISPQGTGQFLYIPPDAAAINTNDVLAKSNAPPGVIGNGSGFVVSPDGYIITNRHVVEDKNRIFRVRFDDGTEKPAEVAAIDTDYDIAMLRIKAEAPLPYLKLADANLPNPGAKCLVLGFPAASLMDFKMQVTSGEISSVDEHDPYQVTLSANTTHGNSGGPIVDRDDNVIGILSAGTTIYNATYLKAISAGQIRQFLDRTKDKQSAAVQKGAATDTPFDSEKLAVLARKATVMVFIIRSDTPDASGN